uniref:Ig-like domain-containing protein n=1 Tax=Labrus bergylta TaxID=56723 RepID=A0A3Q3F1C3_9LABR
MLSQSTQHIFVEVKRLSQSFQMKICFPGESHKLTCTYTGISDGDAHISWIRQAEGKGLEWVSYISAPSGSNKYYSTSVKNRFTISRDNDVDQVYLHMNSLTAEDSAVYYCARMYHCAYFDYWGQGTAVTVNSGTAPTLFPVVQCGSGTGNQITVGCLAHDFIPKSTFQWTDDSGTSLPSVQYSTTVNDNKFTGLSLARVSKSDWDSGNSFNCALTYPGGSKSVKTGTVKPCTHVR